MLRLIDGTELTEEIKEAFKRGVTRAYIKLTDGTIISYDNFLQEIEIEDIRYNEETGTFIGEAVAKRVTLKIYNENNSIDLEDKEFEVFLGAKLVDGTMAWISYGNFIVQKPENDDTKETSEIEAFDYMCKFNQIYKPSVTFPCTYADIAQDICNQCGVELGNSSFRNSQNAVLNNPFINNEQCRVVIKQIAKIAFSWARVATDNKLYFDFENKTMTVADEEINLDNYIDLNKNNETIPVNTIILRNSNIEGENVTEIDEDLIVEYGIQKELVISEDYFAYSEEIRRNLIQAGKALFGLLYTPMKLSGIGTAYLENNDVIAIIDRNGNKRYSYCLNHTIKYNGALYDDIESPAMTETETKYQNESSEDLSRRRTEILVDKHEQKITSIVSEIGDRTGKETSLTQDVDSIKTNVGFVADLTQKVSGINPITLSKCLAGELQELRIQANNSIFNPLYPSSNLYPSSTLYPRGKTYLKIIHQEIDENDVIIETTKTIDLNLSSALRMYNAEIYDEFVYQAVVEEGESKGKVIRRVGILEDGTLYPLSEERIESVEIEDLLLGAGTNIITFNEGHYGLISAIYIQESTFTKIFATTYEVNSFITQLSNSIDLLVKEKVGKDEVIADLNIAIKDGQGVIEFIANTISWKSDNSELSPLGKITLREGKIGGWILDSTTLYNTITENGKEIEAGMFATSISDGPFFYCGRTPGESIYNANFYVAHNGEVKVQRILMNGESGYARVCFDSGKSAMILDKSQLIFRLDDTNNTVFGALIRGSKDLQINLLGALGFSIYDELHKRTLYQADANKGNTPNHYFKGNVWMDKNMDGTYVLVAEQGEWSDSKLKKDIEDCTKKALDVIKQIEFKQFTWNETSEKSGTHIDIGVIAQDLEKIDKNYVETTQRIYKDETQDLLTINTLNLLTTATKAIQELDKKLEKRDKIIEFLAEKLNCKDEVLEMLKEGE